MTSTDAVVDVATFGYARLRLCLTLTLVSQSSAIDTVSYGAYHRLKQK